MSEQDSIKYMIIMRHGDPCSKNGLTETGKEQLKITAKTLEAVGLIPDDLITSYPHRAELSASILSAHFNVAVSRTTDLLNIFNRSFDMAAFLKSLPPAPKIIALSGHDESLQCFGSHLLNDQDTVALFHLLPESRILEVPQNGFKSLHVMSGYADALILQNVDNIHKIQDWRLYGWLADGQINRARDIAMSDPALQRARKFEKQSGPLDLAIRLPA